MRSRIFKRITALAVLAALVMPFGARAGTTGTLRGHVFDAATRAPLAGATVAVVAPSQTAQTTTDASGAFSFISLAPDTYTVSASKTGYDPQSQPGTTVIADQSATVTLTLQKTLRTIARTTSRSAQSLVHAGVTSDVYSINSAGQKAASTLGGSGSLTQAYGAIASAPGVNIPSNQQGWYQSVYIRGGDVDQVAYEFDGLPTTRQSDLAPIATLTSLGNQEVQVYTGGTPATSNSSGLAGYINQVIKTGTYPGYAAADFGVGGPAFYHQATVEAGGATPDRMFSYYVGFSGTNQTFRYGDQYGGVSDPLYFYPLSVPSHNNVYNILDGSGGKAPNYGFIASPGYAYAQATDFDRENVVNLHFGIPHSGGALRDDVQLLYVAGGIAAQFYSSANDVGYTPQVGKETGIGYPMPYLDSLYYTGALMQAPNMKNVVVGFFPSSPTDRVAGSPVDPTDRDGNYNGYSIEKAQYQRNFDSHSYLRALVYGEYSDWFINGPNSAQLVFGSDPADYEVLEHGYGAGLIYSNQLSSQHLLTAEASYMTQKLQTYNAMFSSTDPSTTSLAPTGLGTILSSYGLPDGQCFNWKTGQAWSCFDAGSQGGCLSANGCYPGEGKYNFNLTPNPLFPGEAPAGSPAALAGAHWMMTENGQSAQVDNVTPRFGSGAITDVWQPSDKLVVNFGARFDRFAYYTNDLASGYPARQFWFDAYNNEHCGAPGQNPVWTWNKDKFDPQCPAGFAPMTDPGNGLYNVGAGEDVSNVFAPRASFTYTIDPDTVIRGSAGKYARAEGSSYYQYNTYQQNLASFIAQFYPYGYHTPDHDIYPDTSDNFDLSLEKHVKGTKLSYKVTPFYRDTSNQLQFQAINPVEGTLAGLNVGTQRSYGAELSLQYGDFSRDGLSAILSYTHTENQIRYGPINGVSVIDALNQQIELYNSYTSACAGVTKSSPNWQACGSGADAGNAAPVLRSTHDHGKLRIPNPYYKEAVQPLFDPNGWYTPYDVIPSPFNAANGYEVPDVASLILNYRHGRFAVTPSLHYADGSNYGSPLVWPGYVPQSCSAEPGNTPLTPGKSCSGGQIGAIFLPDPYSGRFDNLGAFMQPAELSLNLQTSYDVTPRMTLTLQAVNLYNQCYQRGYAWDNSVTCVYSNLPSNILAPAGNFLKNPPAQMRYPYGTFFNITEVGISSVLQPFGFFADLSVKL
ncbi:MAG TPA: TonB-dependent receptor [Candidatus Cybelea sp.]|nr:TonB-dependent receptor [Candidatus Cybelea sp.]